MVIALSANFCNRAFPLTAGNNLNSLNVAGNAITMASIGITLLLCLLGLAKQVFA